MDGLVGTGIRAVCGPFTAVAKAGFPISDKLSFSSDSRGATSRSASTSFSSRVNSISFCRNTSYTFFMVMAPALWSMVSNLSRTLAELPVLSRVSAAVKYLLLEV
jgi:hypothetical protein